MAVASDTLDFMERLKAGGVAEREARAITDAFSHATPQQLATKADLDALRAALTADVDHLRTALTADVDTLRLELKVDLQALENRLLVKLGGMAAASVAIVGVMVGIF